MTTLQQVLQAVWDGYLTAYKAGDAAGRAACFTPNGEVHSPYGPPAIGRDAVRVQHVDWVRLGGDGKMLNVEVAHGSGDMGWGPTRYSEGGPSGNGTNLAVFERQSGGHWLVRICSLNSTDPALQAWRCRAGRAKAFRKGLQIPSKRPLRKACFLLVLGRRVGLLLG